MVRAERNVRGAMGLEARISSRRSCTSWLSGLMARITIRKTAANRRTRKLGRSATRQARALSITPSVVMENRIWRSGWPLLPVLASVPGPSDCFRVRRRRVRSWRGSTRRASGATALMPERGLRGEGQERLLEAGRSGRGHDLARRAHAHELAGVDHRDARAHLLDDVDEVRRVEDGAALLGQAPHHLLDVRHRLHVQAVERLVEHQHLGVVEQGGDPADLLLRALGEDAHRLVLVRLQAERAQLLAHALLDARLGEPVEAADEGQVFGGRELLEERARLRHVAQARLHLQRLLEHAAAAHQRVARRWGG